MDTGEFGVECKNCECIACLKNNEGCQNCNKCTGNTSYNRWKINCKRYEECENPEENIKIVLGDIIS